MNKIDLDKKMNNRVIGLTIIKALNSNFNADFTGNPRQILDTFVASPYAVKYCIKKYWESIGEKVFYLKTFKKTSSGKKGEEKIKITPNNLEERFIEMFGDIKDKSADEIVNNLFNCIDVACFGHTAPITKKSTNSTGAIQYGMGLNVFKDSEVEHMEVLSPFQNQNKEGSEQSTMGSRSVLSEGHYVYDFVITPWVYDQLSYVDNFNGFTRRHYELFKEASLEGVTNYNSVAKKDCYNELGLFIELKEGSKKVINTALNNLVDIYNEEDITVIDLSRLKEALLKIEDDIESIEIYYNDITTKVIGLSADDFKNFTTDNIIKTKEINFEEF